MKALTTCLLLGFALAHAGCSTSSPTGPDSTPEKRDAKKTQPGGDPNPAPGKEKRPAANPLVGRWVIKKAGTQDWSPMVSKDAVIEFHDDGDKMTVTDRRADGEGYYVYMGKDGFRFQVKFTRKDGTSDGGYGGLMQVTKMTDREIVGDLFTLERAK